MYVGITGASSLAEIQSLLDLYQESPLHTLEHCSLSLGIGATYDSLRGLDMGKRYPDVLMIKELLTSYGSLCVLHYTPTRRGMDLCSHLQRVLSMFSVHRLQLNLSVTTDLAWLKKDYPQVHLTLATNDMLIILPNLGYADSILLDASGGKGIPLVVDLYVRMYKEIKRLYPAMPIGFAGGLSRENAEHVVCALKQGTQERFSIDAESGLRDDMDNLDKQLVSDYFSAAFRGISR